MRLAIFGGSFDPPHVGHLLAAQDAFEQLSLDRLVFVPAATQPLKVGRTVASASQRLAMVRLLVDGDPRFEVSPVEVERSGLSFTVDTLEHFTAAHPGAELFLLVGADVLDTFSQWREPEQIAKLAHLVVLERVGDRPASLPAGLEGRRVERLPTRRMDVSSTEIRERVRAGKSIRGFVMDSVAAFIARDGLYR
ncbi:MAG TPA: nicotinate-nucleotide adenylyltransferase [Gemmatimonadaceae bacterium]|nr:nicotinate-nucleotide adenylyltransferase [Gemmatimonadaceae bacterium]